MKIGIATPTLVEGDAVGNDVIGMYMTIKRLGHNPILYAHTSKVYHPVKDMHDIENDLDVFIYHHSIACDVGVETFVDLDCRKILKYHNITPPEYFNDPYMQMKCQTGINQLSQLLDTECEIWVDSEFNGLDLFKIKQCSYKIIPPFNQVDMLMNADIDARIALPYNDWHRNVLVVGRIAPNKNIEMAVDAIAECKNTRLILVGDASGGYADNIRKKAANMKNVIITEKVGIPALKAFYVIADAFLTTSKHEGFCIPAVEAMAMSVPVIANSNCALPYTCGDAAHYANTVEEIVEGINHVIENKSSFIQKGQERFKSMYHNPLIESKIASAFNDNLP